MPNMLQEYKEMKKNQCSIRHFFKHEPFQIKHSCQIMRSYEVKICQTVKLMLNHDKMWDICVQLHNLHSITAIKVAFTL